MLLSVVLALPRWIISHALCRRATDARKRLSGYLNDRSDTEMAEGDELIKEMIGGDYQRSEFTRKAKGVCITWSKFSTSLIALDTGR